MDSARDGGRRLDRDLLHGICAEIDDARDRLEQLAVGLCLDDAVSMRHADALQGFDAIAQVLGEVAALLRHEGGAATATAAIRLEAMRTRFAAAGYGRAA